MVEKERPQRDGSGGGSTTNMLAMGILGSSFLGVVMLTSPFITMQLRSPLPYMSTPRRKVLDALKEIEQRRRAATRTCTAGTRSSTTDKLHTGGISPASATTTSSSKPLRYYDLGSGDGETVLAAASLGWRATGIELNSTLWAISSIRRLSQQLSIRRHCNFIWGNMWNESIHDADAVMIFGVKPLMKDIANKIATECRPGTFVMSYRFHVPIYSVANDGSTESSGTSGSNNNGALRASLVYDKDEMRIYELNEIDE